MSVHMSSYLRKVQGLAVGVFVLGPTVPRSVSEPILLLLGKKLCLAKHRPVCCSIDSLCDEARPHHGREDGHGVLLTSCALILTLSGGVLKLGYP